jgi:hypothetical protein
MRPVEAREMMAAALELPNNKPFWKDRGHGLAIFVSPANMLTYRVAQELEETCRVGERFHVKSLLPLLASDQRCFVLALSQNHSRVFRGDRHQLVEMEVPGWPQRMDETLNLDATDRGEQVHSGGAVGVGKQAGVFHGQGGQRDRRKDDLRSYFQEVNRALQPVLRNEPLPLVLAGVEYLLPIFRDVCQYAELVDAELPGNYDYQTPYELHEKLRPVIAPLLERDRQAAIRKYEELAGTNRASDDIRQVLPAATAGRVEALLVANNQHQWGSFKEATATVEVHPDCQAGDDDLLDRVAVATLQGRGEVYALEPAEMPTQSPLAAVYRY